MRKALCLVGAVAVLLGGCSPIVAPPSADERYWGTWINEDPDTGGITRVVLEPWTVHMWGACTPTDCDWGEAPYSIHEEELHVFWDQGFALEVQVLTLVPNGTLQVETTTYFTDGTGSMSWTDTFVREIAIP
jgi:hypothetical protein